MTSIEVLSTSSNEQSADELRGARIDGTEKIPGGLMIVGWALGHENQVEGVEVLHDGTVVASAGLGAPRPDTALAHPDLPEARSCGFRVPVTADGLPDAFELALQVVLEGEGRAPIGLVRGRKVVSFEELLGGHLDGIEQAWNQATVLGWALAGDVPVSGIEILHEGRVVANGELGIGRPDIAEAYPGVAYADRSGFRITFPAADVPEEFQLEGVAVLEDGRRVVLGKLTGRRRTGGGWDPAGVQQGVPTLKPRLRELILRSATEMGIDALWLPQPGDTAAGQPPSSSAVETQISALDQLELHGKRVLEIDSGIGELSRRATARGAVLVDGFERKAEMIGLARLLNAYYGATRISFFCRDAADPASYEETYDVVLALGDPKRLEPALEAVAGATNGILVAELEPADRETAAALEQHWPCKRTLGGGPKPRHKVATAFGHDEDALAALLR